MASASHGTAVPAGTRPRRVREPGRGRHQGDQWSEPLRGDAAVRHRGLPRDDAVGADDDRRDRCGGRLGLVRAPVARAPRTAVRVGDTRRGAARRAVAPLPVRARPEPRGGAPDRRVHREGGRADPRRELHDVGVAGERPVGDLARGVPPFLRTGDPPGGRERLALGPRGTPLRPPAAYSGGGERGRGRIAGGVMARRALLALMLAAGAVVLPAVAATGPDEGAHEDHPSTSELQARIDAASPGDVVHIESGMYHGNLLVDVPVVLHGMGRPLIQGDGTGSVITVSAPGAVVDGLSVRGSGPGPVGGPAGVRVEATATGAVIRDVVGEGSYYGGDGISLWDAEDVLVRDNAIRDARDGVFLSFGKNALIDRNRISGSRYAVHSMFAEELTLSENLFEENLSGAVMMYGGRVLLLRNAIHDSHSPSTGFGVLLKDVEDVEVAENVLTGNRVGVQVDGPPAGAAGEIRIHRNTVALNRFGVSLYPSGHATFFANSFVENTVQVVAQGTGVAGKNEWSFEGVGNFWSDYRGYD